MATNVNEVHKENLTRLDRFAILLTGLVGTVWCFFAFCLLVFVPFVFHGSLPLVQFISSAFLQLVLLPLILVAGNLQQRHAQLRAENDYAVNRKAEQEITDLKRKVNAIYGLLTLHMEAAEKKKYTIIDQAREAVERLQKLKKKREKQS